MTSKLQEFGDLTGIATEPVEDEAVTSCGTQHLEHFSAAASTASDIERHIQAANVNLGDLQRRFKELCDLAESIQRRYAQASDETRRHHNQFWFKFLDVTDDKISNHVLEDLPGVLLDRAGPEALRNSAKIFERQTEDQQWLSLVEELRNEEPDAQWASGSNVSWLVAGAGFEPATFGL